MKRSIIIMLAISLIIAGIISWFASPSPDGLERVAEDKGFIEKAVSPVFKILPDYTIPGMNKFFSNSVAGIIGTVVTFCLVLLIGRVISCRKSGEESNEP